ncbi:uncharacterized protein LOC132743831 [Ruditapes philippinarum]|uniref:uncharacterized protein LOC132743831 n=1 Tax=Ruditapes philippinarum TaxID=129788 RepID=UPI00295C1A93|nr:uncharacterized protein LOC132743831 [Ruditapes philippinarum]
MGFFVCLIFVLNCLKVSDASSIDNNPGSVSIHENYDGTHTMWGIAATCYVRYTTSYQCSTIRSQSCGWWGWSTCYYYVAKTCYRHAFTDVACNQFYINSDPSGNFQMSGFAVQKKTCTSPYCGPTCNADGCLNNGESHTVGVTAYRTGYETDGSVSGSFTVNVYAANPPTFYYSSGNSISVSHDTAGIGTVINTLVPSFIDNGHDYDYIRYRQNSGPGNSYIHGTSDLFYLDTSNGQVKVGKDLTMEFSYYFNMNLCVYDRRHREVCHDLNITLWACFQTPTCNDQSDNSIIDTYGTYTYGHGGSSNTIFNMDYPQPTEHFPAFSSVWHKLTWTFDLNEFPEAAINSDTGEIYITRNISIWPSWPTQDYNQVVRVANSESCYTTTCNFKVRIHYTNWPIDIRSLPTTYYLHEDYDWEIHIHSLITYDYNYYWEDNVTCQIISWSPSEADMFELRHDGRHAYNSYNLYKLRCQTPGCGYKYQQPRAYYCDTDIGCLTHNRTQQYTVTIQCWDGYNSTDVEVFTFRVVKNAVPAYRHLPTHIDLNRQTVSYLDNIFEIMYSDAENENLIYEYTYQDVDTNIDPNYFLGTTWGNYYNQLGNITMTTYLWDKEVNKTYRIHVCGHERRNEICEDLTIDVEEYCSATPQCNDATFSTNTEASVGDEMFDISSLVVGGPFNDLSYSIKSQSSSLFALDYLTGSVTLAEKFDEIFDSSTYSIIAYVYNEGACSYAQCQISIIVTAVNYPVVITNLPATVPISEDTTTTKTLFTVVTSDDNIADTYTCAIVNTMSVEPFYLDRDPPVSGDYAILIRENGGLSSATTTYSVSIECTDSHSGSDTDVLTITITLNEAPTFTGFTTATPNSFNADPMNYKVGDTLYTVAATDNEGDDLIFTCTIANSQVPYECETEATSVKLKINRELRIVDDDGQTYSVQICLKDPKHADQCGDLDVTFTRDKTHPEITNLPHSESFPEDTSVGTALFTAAISNPDVGETTTITVRIDPTSELSVFTLDTSNGILTLGQFLDFERVNSYMFTFSVSDNYLDGLAEKTLKLAVTNVNEGNSISATTTTISFTEDTAVGTELSDPGLSCTDIDGDSTQYAIQINDHYDYFSIDSNNGHISLAKVWDLEDSSTELPSSTSLIISCTDPGGLSSTTAITVNVEDVNDHAPVLLIDAGFSQPIAVINF